MLWLRLGQTLDTLGSSYLILQNRVGINGALFKTTDTLNYLVDFAFMMANAIQRDLRLEGRAPYAKAGTPSFLLGGTDLAAATLAVGDTYAGITKLAVGSYTSPGTNALSITGNTTISGTLTSGGLITASAGMTVSGNVSMPGYLFCAGLVSATGTKLTSTGQVSYTVARLSGYAAGAWTITFASAHPLGANYIITTTGRGLINSYVSSNPAPTATAFVVVLGAAGTATPAVDSIFSFMVLAS